MTALPCDGNPGSSGCDCNYKKHRSFSGKLGGVQGKKHDNITGRWEEALGSLVQVVCQLERVLLKCSTNSGKPGKEGTRWVHACLCSSAERPEGPGSYICDCECWEV